jgi:hypothetical protein
MVGSDGWLYETSGSKKTERNREVLDHVTNTILTTNAVVRRIVYACANFFL